MSAWSQTDLVTIGDADEIEAAPDRAEYGLYSSNYVTPMPPTRSPGPPCS
jgi:hypothetical protein